MFLSPRTASRSGCIAAHGASAGWPRVQAVALGVDAENPCGAKRLYEKVGFYETQRFCIYRRRIAGEAPESRL